MGPRCHVLRLASAVGGCTRITSRTGDAHTAICRKEGDFRSGRERISARLALPRLTWATEKTTGDPFAIPGAAAGRA